MGCSTVEAAHFGDSARLRVSTGASLGSLMHLLACGVLGVQEIRSSTRSVNIGTHLILPDPSPILLY